MLKRETWNQEVSLTGIEPESQLRSQKHGGRIKVGSAIGRSSGICEERMKEVDIKKGPGFNPGPFVVTACKLE